MSLCVVVLQILQFINVSDGSHPTTFECKFKENSSKLQEIRKKYRSFFVKYRIYTGEHAEHLSQNSLL